MKRNEGRFWTLAPLAILALSALFCLALTNSACCPRYTPNLGGGYDVLKPNEIVKRNPLGFVVYDVATGIYSIQWDTTVKHDGNNIIVNKEFLAWALELEQEIANLRKFIKK